MQSNLSTFARRKEIRSLIIKEQNISQLELSRHFIYLLKPDLQCFVTKKARKITIMQYKEQADTFRYWRSLDEMRQDAVYSLYYTLVYHRWRHICSRAKNIHRLNQVAAWTKITQYRDNDISVSHGRLW